MPRILSPSDVADFRNRLCDVATEFVSEAGRENFNMRELASRLGVSAMTTYRYFKDKDEILAAVRARGFSRLAARLEAVLATNGPATKKLASIGRAYLAFAREESAHYKLMFDLTQASPVHSAESRIEYARIRAAFSKQARNLIDENHFDGDENLIGEILWSVLHGQVALNLAGGLPDVDRSIEEAMRMFVSGFTRRAKTFELERANERGAQSGERAAAIY